MDMQIFLIDAVAENKGVQVMVFNATFQQYFSYIVVVSFIGGGNQYR
jgi:hypothetical protein